MNRPPNYLALLLLCLLAVSGCERSAPPPAGALAAGGGAAHGGVAIIDLDRIAQQTGYDQVIQGRIQEQEKQLHQQLESYRQQLLNPLHLLVQTYGPTPTAAQQQRLDEAKADADRQLSQAVMQAQQISDQYRGAIINSFREVVRPLAAQVAQRRGLAVVMANHEGILSVAAAADITGEVIPLLPPPQSLRIPPPAGLDLPRQENAPPTGSGPAPNVPRAWQSPPAPPPATAPRG